MSANRGRTLLSKVIDGQLFRDMVQNAACAIEEKKQETNELNVFPVPDGDTGTNMSLTMGNAMTELAKLPDGANAGRIAEVTASALLRGARGNSGVILSLLFRGFAKRMKGLETATATDFACALGEGVETAYKAVMKPAEGTILTVSRVSAEKAIEACKAGADFNGMFDALLEEAHQALIRTTDQNPVLKKAGVVDAGAYGYIVILEGMQEAFSGKKPKVLDYLKKAEAAAPQSADFTRFDTEDIKFMYCTEFIASRDDKRRSVPRLRSFLETIGDCVVVVDDDEIVKVHVHTNTPDRVLCEALKFGALLTVKIENMKQQHTSKVIEREEDAAPAGKKHEIAAPERKYGFVSVAAGDGVRAIFEDLGVDRVVEGGQTMNPSTEDILYAIDATPAEVVYVLPNNKNIIMAAEQAIPLSEKQVIVLKTKTIPQGISAMLAFDPDKTVEENTDGMDTAISAVKTGQITYAARDSEFDGSAIKEGDFMALLEGKLNGHSKKFEETAKRLAKDMCDKDAQFITVITGADASAEQTDCLRQAFENEAKDAEITVVNGGQPVYYFIVSVE